MRFDRLIGRLFRSKRWRLFVFIATVFTVASLTVKSLAQNQSPPPWMHPDSVHVEADDLVSLPIVRTTGSLNRRSAPNVSTAADTAANLTCDSECLRFRQHLADWPADKPKAAIILLIQRKSIPIFDRSVRLLDANFNDVYRYPIILFHEENMQDASHRQQLQAMTNASLFFQLVRFDIPDFINRSAVPFRLCFKTVGYRHMCRFQAKTVYEQPILAGLDYVLRLDDDSYIYRPIGYDIFRLMRDRKIQYGFTTVVSDYGPCVVGLWPAIVSYMKERNIKSQFRWPRGRIYWNNFEISDMSVWRSPEYRDYIEYIDRLGGIYYHRWGDATIKTAAVTLFVPKDRTYHFKDIAYKHGKRYKPPQ